MKAPLFITLCLLTPFFLNAKLVSLTSTDGRSISASIDSYSEKKNAVAIRINGEGRVVPIPMDRLDEASQKTVLEWNELNAIVKFLSIDTERIATGKGERTINIELRSQSRTSIKGLRMEYEIPIKKSYMEKQAIQGSNKTKYVRVTDETVITGTIDIGDIPAQSNKQVKTEAITISEIQLLDQGKNKEPKPVTNKHSPKGVLLKLYIGDQLVREYESQNGVKQLIYKYNK